MVIVEYVFYEVVRLWSTTRFVLSLQKDYIKAIISDLAFQEISCIICFISLHNTSYTNFRDNKPTEYNIHQLTTYWSSFNYRFFLYFSLL